MNYHSDDEIMSGVHRHYDEILKFYESNKIVCIYYTGAANYYADYENSDVDTWAIIIDDNYNENHYQVSAIDLGQDKIFICDIRAYINGLYYSDWVYLPGLYTKYIIVNPLYEQFYNTLKEQREKFAYNNVPTSVNSAIAIFNFHCNKILGPEVDTKPYAKRMYYCMLILLHINTYKYKLPYSTLFYNPVHGDNLRKIKTNDYSYSHCCQFLTTIIQQIMAFHPSKDEYPNFVELISLNETLKAQILERCNHGHPN